MKVKYKEPSWDTNVLTESVCQFVVSGLLNNEEAGLVEKLSRNQRSIARGIGTLYNTLLERGLISKEDVEEVANRSLAQVLEIEKCEPACTEARKEKAQ